MGWSTVPELQSPPGWSRMLATPSMAGMFGPPKDAQSFGDYLAAGWQTSVTGLATRGRMPNTQITTETPWYGRAAAGVSGIVGDFPLMVPGFLAGTAIGAPAGPIGSAVGAFGVSNALPAAVRATLMEAYSKGEVIDSQDFINRAMHVALETFKAGAIGVAMGGAGIGVKTALLAKGGIEAGIGARIASGAAAPDAAMAATAGKILAGRTAQIGVTSAEAATMAVTAAALDGRPPEPRDFIDAGVLLFGLKGSGVAAKKLMNVYRETGKTPFQVLADIKEDPSILKDLADTPDTQRIAERSILLEAEQRNNTLREITEKPDFLKTLEEKVLEREGPLPIKEDYSPELKRALEIENKPGFLRSAQEKVFLDEMKVRDIEMVKRELPPEEHAPVVNLLKSELNRLGMQDIALEIEGRLSGGRADALYKNGVIQMALDTPPNQRAGVLNHEVVHAMKDLGVITNNEWKVLESQAKKWVDDKTLRLDGKTTREVYVGLDETGLMEEAIADANRAMSEGRMTDTALAGFMQKLNTFLEALSNALRGRGFQTASDVLARIQSGEVGARVRGFASSNERASLRASIYTDEPATVKPIGDRWAVVRKLTNGGEAHEYYRSEQDAKLAIVEREASDRVTANRAAGVGVRWWVESPTEFVRTTGVGRLDSVGRADALRATLAARRDSIKTEEQGRALRQLPEREGFCFKCAAEAAAVGVGDMVIGLSRDHQNQSVWHSVVVRDGMVYDPTFAKWFEPGVYEKLGFRPELTLTPEQVREFINKTGGLAPDAENQGLAGKASLRASARAEDIREFPRAYRPLVRATVMQTAFPEGIDKVKLKDLIDNPKGLIPDEKAPNYINFRYVEGPDALRELHAAVSEHFTAEIEATRGTQSWDKTFEDAAKYINGDGSVNSIAVKQAASNAIVRAAAMDVLKTADAVVKEQSPENLQAHEVTMQMLVAAEAMDQGLGADIARALNVRKAAKQSNLLANQIIERSMQYGMQDGVKRTVDPKTLAKMLLDLKDKGAGEVAKLARTMSEPTWWDMVVEAWKAGLVSGPITHVTNMFGTGAFVFLRPAVEELAVLTGMLRGAKVGFGEGDRASAWEPLYEVLALFGGMQRGLAAGAASFKYDDAGKVDQYRPAIPGLVGEVIRTPFKLLSAEDTVWSTMILGAQQTKLAVRQAITEGHHPMTREFTDRVNALMDDPKFTATAEDAARRFTFNTPLGEKGQSVASFVKEWNLQWMVPFIRTPLNIVEEMIRMSPFAPAAKSWREAMAKGGDERDKAIAEAVLGTGIMTVAIGYAMSGEVSGAGSPDPGKKRGKQAAGWQPYSVLVGDTWYNYQRIQPMGTLVGMAADIAEMWDHMTDEEKDKLPKMAAVAFSNAITNQTFLQGITNVVNAMSDPTRYGPRFIQQLVASTIPNIVGQTTTLMDPQVREVNSILDAVKARIPGEREQLQPKMDVFGQPIQTKERLGAISPVTETKVSDDLVRKELDRLGISVAPTPKKLHIGRGSGKFGEIDLTPEQRTVYARVSGEMAYKILDNVVNSPNWNQVPDLIKRKIYQKTFAASHRMGAIAAIPEDQRTGILMEAAESLQQEMRTP